MCNHKKLRRFQLNLLSHAKSIFSAHVHCFHSASGRVLQVESIRYSDFNLTTKNGGDYERRTAAPRLELFFYYIFRNNPAEIVLFSNSRRHTQSPFLLSSRVRLNHALNLYSRVLGACSRYLYLNTSPITWSATELCWSLMSDEDEWMASQ